MAAEDDKRLPTPDRKQPDLLLSDCLCPICMSILIEPVTMPCSHELCMPCFRKNVEEANFTCPMCRVRISSWARKRARGNNLVDQKRWKVIQEAFPEKCRRRLEGLEDESFEEEIISHHVPLISQPGEVRKEYEEQLNKLMQQKKQQEELEMKASAELIQKLQNQELKEIAERKKAAEMQRLRDEELAKKLSTNLNEEIPVVEPEPEPEQSFSVLNDEELAKKLYDQINHIPEGDEELARKLQTELNQVCSPQRSPDTPAVPGQAKKTASTHRKGSRSSAGSKESLVSIETFFARAAAKSTTPSMSDSESCAFADYISEPLPSRSSSEATESYDPDQEVLSEIIEEKKQDKANEASEQGTRRREKSPSEHGGRNSATSIDSITPELNHFKPIHSSPRTPPKRRQDGTLQTPVIIHTTPCNLNKSKLKEEENWLERSPLVMAKWLSLAEERKQVLANQSKGTMTDSKAVRPSPHALLVTQNGVFNKKKQNIHDGNTQKYTWNTRRQKAPSTITPTNSSEASTLHSGHSSKHDTLLDFTARETYDSIDAGITSLKIPISYKSDSDEEMPPVLLPQKETTKSKVRSQTMPTLVSQSDDLTCKSYNEPTKSSTRAKESETHSTKTRARRKSGNRNNNNSGLKEIESNEKPPQTSKSNQVQMDTKTSKVRTITDMFGRNVKKADKSMASHNTSDSDVKKDKTAKGRTVSETSSNYTTVSPRSPRKADLLPKRHKTRTQDITDQEKSSSGQDKDFAPKSLSGQVKESQLKTLSDNSSCGDNQKIQFVSPSRSSSSQVERCLNEKVFVANYEGKAKCSPERLQSSNESRDDVTIADTPSNPAGGAKKGRRRQHSGDRGNKSKKLKLDRQQPHRTLLDKFAIHQKSPLSQEELDFQLAMKLQRQYDSDWRQGRNQVSRAKGTKDSYMLRHNTTNSDPAVHIS